MEANSVKSTKTDAAQVVNENTNKQIKKQPRTILKLKKNLTAEVKLTGTYSMYPMFLKIKSEFLITVNCFCSLLFCSVSQALNPCKSHGRSHQAQ